MIELLFFLSVTFFTFRIIYTTLFKSSKPKLDKNCKTIIVIGSGGHTSEMMKLIETLNPNLYQPRLYILAETDNSSLYKIQKLEEEFKKYPKTHYNLAKIPRSRVVGQSYFTSVLTTLYSTLKCIPVIFKFNPDLILCNGPGTCIPICLVAFLRNALLFFSTRIVFIESICRVKSLSLSGKILLYIADVVIVQWEKLHERFPCTVFLGRLV